MLLLFLNLHLVTVNCFVLALRLFQVERLRSVLNEQVEIHGRGNFPTLSVRLHDLIICVRDSLRAAGIGPKNVKMNGGAASYVVATEEFAYSDLDLIFPMSFESEQSFDSVSPNLFFFPRLKNYTVKLEIVN